MGFLPDLLAGLGTDLLIYLGRCQVSKCLNDGFNETLTKYHPSDFDALLYESRMYAFRVRTDEDGV